ncbi:MAG: DUF1501 domain-containing protein [Myxococcales bacterium]|nr:DUF1501 domain-containing protein [Myxococcales bacterium]
MNPTRRHFLLGSAALGALGLPLTSARAVPGNQRKLVIVYAPGGWDITRVFAPEFSNRAVAMEAAAERATAGGISYVSHPGRPNVDAFFANHHRDALVVNGMMVRSIAHEICTMITMTGTSSGLAPDWPAIVADTDRTGYTLPHLVLSGPSFPGDKGVAVARTGLAGQLEALVSGEVDAWSATSYDAPDRVREAVIDRYLQRRATARAMGTLADADARQAQAFADSATKLGDLKGLRYGISFTSSLLLQDQARVAADALSQGVSRCVTMSYAGAQGQGWDTHANNDDLQSPLWDELFGGLLQLMVELRSTPGTSAATLADETLVVVMSEMGRTPNINGTNGKDHWPYTSAMLIGPGVTGDRVVGGFDDTFYGKAVDPASGEVGNGAPVLSAESLGATLLSYCDIDPGPFVSGVTPLTGVLA